jgi:hypothetical protein
VRGGEIANKEHSMTEHFASTTRILFTTLVLILGLVAAQAQTTWYVDDDAPNDPGPGDPNVSDPNEDGSPDHPFDAIQEGINAAADGDTVLVADGIYAGSGNRDIDFGGGAITVRSENGPDTCIVDCDHAERGVGFFRGETNASVLQGFTITSGYTMDGGGIFCDASSPTIADCIICNATAVRHGGAIHCDSSNPILSGCTLAYNAATGDGGGIHAYNTQLTMTNCRVIGNAAGWGGGLYLYGNSSLTMTNCAISGNAAYYRSGGAAYLAQATVDMSNCTITGNKASSNGASIHCYSDADLTMTNCIVWDDWAYFDDSSLFVANATLTVSYCDIEGGQDAVSGHGYTLNWGDGNIDQDPMLTRAKVHLKGGSPCINAGDPNGDYTGQSDLDGEGRVQDGRVDMGADEFLDTDGDELPDWWELRYFGSETVADPIDDDDDDDLPNLDEYEQDRNPLKPPLTYYVDPAGDDTWDGLAPSWDGEHGPKATVQAAIRATGRYEGDAVILNEGIYTGRGNRHIGYLGKLITVRSTDPNDPAVVANTVIDCQADSSNRNRGFNFVCDESSDAVLAGLTIRNGYTRSGGGIYIAGFSPVRISHCVITQNTGSAAYGGGGICCFASSPTITRCSISANVSGWHGGGMMCLYVTAHDVIIDNCNITGNTAADCGGGLYLDEHCPATITNCLIAGNTAGTSGGGIGCHELYDPMWGTPIATIANCLIVGNTASEGGGISSAGSNPRIADCTLVQNAADYGGGLLCASGPEPWLVNSVLWGSQATTAGAQLALRESAVLTVSHCDLEGGLNAVYVEDGSSLTWAYGNLEADPLFTDADGGDDDPNTWADNDYHLAGGSPCIDAGCNVAVPLDAADLDADDDTVEQTPLDLDGEGRFFDDPDTPNFGCCGTGVVVDMGAYEYGDTGPQPCPGDLDGDQDVDQSDLGMLLAMWQAGDGGDLDCDGTTDQTDLGILLALWGEGT